MSKKKSRKQLANTNNKKGQAKRNHKTVDKESLIVEYDYPPELITDAARFYYECLMHSCNAMTVLFHDVDKYQVAQIAEQMVIRDTLMREAREKPILNEQNGNTGIWQTKPNPAIKLYMDFDKNIRGQLKDLGLTPIARADIYAKMATLNSNEVIDEKTAEAIHSDNFAEYIKAGKVKVV